MTTTLSNWINVITSVDAGLVKWTWISQEMFSTEYSRTRILECSNMIFRRSQKLIKESFYTIHNCLTKLENCTRFVFVKVLTYIYTLRLSTVALNRYTPMLTQWTPPVLLVFSKSLGFLIAILAVSVKKKRGGKGK